MAQLIQTPGAQRDRLTEGIYLPEQNTDALGRLERAFLLSHQSEAVARTLKSAVRAGKLPKQRSGVLIEQAEAAGILNSLEADLLRNAEAAREDYIQVDSFATGEYLSRFIPAESTSVSSGDGDADAVYPT